MRPLRLYMENFGSFREATTTDFSEADYFVLVGATGAGKSTVIDAICFALYGTVPRWGKENVIAHALAPSAVAGKVALVFEAGRRRYVAIRALQRNARGTVQTKVARLEELDCEIPADASLETLLAAVVETVAEGDQVTASVPRITGLSYKFFTQCVVLPQGRFTEFLHAPPRQRQDLLVQLLDAEIYEEIRKGAVLEEKSATQEADFTAEQLAELAYADEAAENTATARVTALRRLSDEVGGELNTLREREQVAAALQDELTAVREGIATLTELAMPDGVPPLADKLRIAKEMLDARDQEASEADQRERTAEEAAARLGDQAALTADLAAHDSRAGLMARLSTAQQEVTASSAELGPQRTRLEEAKTAAVGSEHELARLRTVHMGAELARQLTVGEPCPTCLQVVHELPNHEPSGDISTAEAALSLRQEQASQEAQSLHRAEHRVELRTDDVRRLEAELAGHPTPAADRAETERLLHLVKQASAAATSARQEARDVRDRLAAARERHEDLRHDSDMYWRELDRARDTVVTFNAPPLERGNLHHAWRELLSWRERAVGQQRLVLTSKIDALTRVQAHCDTDRARITARLAADGVDVPQHAGPDAVKTALITHISSAERTLERIREDRARAARLAVRVKAKKHEAQVAHELANLLRANAFERWLCREAMDLLVLAASDTLHELSDGQYELVLNDTAEIEVIDHAEAGMRRSARTLSGGETFQAALALALALSGQISGLATMAAGRLDSIFLDEGFGTLDPVTLDTVATTLERLAAGNERMVGVVTHVQALADRIPVRFEVTRDVKGSHLRQVGA